MCEGTWNSASQELRGSGADMITYVGLPCLCNLVLD